MNVYPKISNRISKLGEGIATVNLPPVLTCRRDSPCFHECYAIRGNFAYTAVKTGLNKNYQSYLESPKRFFDVLDMQLNMVPYRFFRYHSSGEIIDERYLEGMCWLARRHKGTKFLCFTKKFELVNDYLIKHKKPSNLILVLSNWKDWLCDNPHNLPTSYVKFKNADYYIPDKASLCSGSCATCVNTDASCWNLKKGQSVYFKKH